MAHTDEITPRFSAVKPTHKYCIDRLVEPSDRNLLCPIRYVYNCLPQSIEWLKPQPVTLPSSFCSATEKRRDSDSRSTAASSIKLSVSKTSLPIHTGLIQFGQTRYWEANIRAATTLLELFAGDQRCADINIGEGESMASQAAEQLKTSVLDTYGRYSMYMFPHADEGRTQLLAQSMVLIFVFDDMWERGSTFEELKELRASFVASLKGALPAAEMQSPLQQRMSEIRQGFLKSDEEEGNAGSEVLQQLIDFCYHPPATDYTCVQDYLDYRFSDACHWYTFACAKFSIRSSVDQNNPKFNRFLRYLGHQLAIANDIASYDKEKRQHQANEAAAMINIVHVIAKNENMEDEQAKGMAYAWQLWIENQVIQELKQMENANELNHKEWEFVDACLSAACGNMFSAVVIARYGGEKARLVLDGDSEGILN